MGDSWRTYERGPSLVGWFGLLCRYKRFLSCLGGSSHPSMKYHFTHRTLFTLLVPHRPATWAGSRAGSPACLCVSDFSSSFSRSDLPRGWRYSYRPLFSLPGHLRFHRQVHGLINHIDTKAKCRHLKILTCRGTLRQVIIRVYRLEIQSVMLVSST
jgi:hypothetical protein